MTHFSMLDNLRDIPGENNQDKETDQAKDPEVDKEEMKNLQSEIDVLKAHLKHTENLNNLLKKQLEINTDSKFDPELIVNMAEQIQKLENELEKARRNESAEEKTKDGATTTKKSAIPVRKDAKLPTGEDSDHSPLMNNFPKLTKQTGNEKGNFVLFRFSMNFVNFRIGITAAWWSAAAGRATENWTQRLQGTITRILKFLNCREIDRKETINFMFSRISVPILLQNCTNFRS